MNIRMVKCRSVLNRSGIPGIDYGINPYIGCAHKCQYCYAVFMKKFSGHTEAWGDFVDIKENAPDILAAQLRRLKKRSSINFGTVCDAYQPAEIYHKITRRCLQLLIPYRHSVSILTKSPLVTRDLDIFKQLHEIEIGFTIITLDPLIKRVFEPHTAQAVRVLDAVRKLSQEGIDTWIFVAPVLPGITDRPQQLIALIRSAQKAGARYILFDTLNPYPKVWRNVNRLASRHFPEAKRNLRHYQIDPATYKNRLGTLIARIGLDHLIPCRTTFGCG
jgi:DNA repair photolyase